MFFIKKNTGYFYNQTYQLDALFFQRKRIESLKHINGIKMQ